MTDVLTQKMIKLEQSFDRLTGAVTKYIRSEKTEADFASCVMAVAKVRLAMHELAEVS